MHAPPIIQDLAIVLVAASLLALVFHRLRLPLVLGYILAGVLVGPHLFEPGLVRSPASLETLGGLGVVFLLFSLGLEFSLSHLREVGLGGLVVGLLEIPFMLWAGFQLAGLLGWEGSDRVFLAAVVAISSTTIIVKILAELGLGREPFARRIYAVLVVEDILAVLILAALSAIATTGRADVGGLARTGAGVSLFLILTAAIGSLLAPRILARFSRAGGGELLATALMGILFAVCLLASRFGYSVALGAFLAGAVVGETREFRNVARMIAPLRDIFGAVFFVSVGMAVDPSAIPGLWLPILAVSALVITGKIAACSLGAFVAGDRPRDALRAGMGLAQIGEFSFVIAQMGLALGVVSGRLLPVAVGASVLTALASPFLIRSSDGAVGLIARLAPSPLVTYAGLYHRWVGGLAVPGTARQVWLVARKPILQTLLNLLAASAVLFGARRLAGGFGGEAEVASRALDAGVWTISFLAAMPFLIAAWRKVRAISMIFAEAALLGHSMPEARALALRSLISNTGALLAGLLMAAWILALTAAFLPPLPVLLAAAAFIATLTVVLYRWMVRFQASLQAGLQRLAERPAEPAASRSPSNTMELIRRYYPYGSAAVEIEIPRGTAAEGKALKDLAIRSVTGATVVAVERDGVKVEDVAGSPLRAGDRLLLMGEEAQIEAARAILVRRA